VQTYQTQARLLDLLKLAKNTNGILNSVKNSFNSIMDFLGASVEPVAVAA